MLCCNSSLWPSQGAPRRTRPAPDPTASRCAPVPAGDDTDAVLYTVSGTVTQDGSGGGIAGVEISFTGGYTPVTTDAGGEWSKSGLTGAVTVTPVKDGWAFGPETLVVEGPTESADFLGTESDALFAGGSGTELDPYKVATAAQLNEIRNYLHCHFVQTADIDLIDYAAGNGWLPIGPTFHGSFDGAGHTISGLVIDRSSDGTGLFAVSGGHIQNVTLTGVDIDELWNGLGQFCHRTGDRRGQRGRSGGIERQ